MKNNYIIYSVLISFLAFFIASCDDNYQSSIPDFPVNLPLNLTSTYPTFKNSNNQFLLFENSKNKSYPLGQYVGYGGILVYTGFDGEYYAFDMSCPYEAKQTTRVHPNDIGQAICDSCHSVFDLGYGIGNPSTGPAKEVLKKYRAILNGDVLYISR
jgi:nitrite reductase/ring-hydroxylating ferredoxin subunit